MKLVFDKDTLSNALESSCSILTSKNLFAVLNNVLIKVKDNNCTIVSTDLTDTMHLKCAIVSGEDCEFLINGKTILSLLKTLPKGDVCLDINEALTQAMLISGKFKANVSLISKNEFPAVSEFDGAEKGLKFKFVDLKNALAFVLPFVSADLSREIFCGIHFGYNFKDNKEAFVTLCATDGHRLAKTDLIAKDIEAEQPTEDGIIISTKAVQIFSKFFSPEQDVLIILKDRTKAIFKSDTVTLTTSLINGTFPDFSCVIPDTTKHIIVNKEDIINSLKRCALFNPKNLSAKLEINKNNVNVTCLSSEVGSMSEDIECTYESDPVTVGVNSKYLEQSLSMVDDNVAVIGIIDEDSPIKIISMADYESKDEGTLSVVMPMMV